MTKSRHSLRSFLVLAAVAVLAACGGGGDDPAAPAPVVISEHRASSGSLSTAGIGEKTVLQSTYQNDGTQAARVQAVVNVAGLSAAPAANIDHAVVHLTITSGSVPLTTKVVISATEAKQNGSLIYDFNVAPGLKVDVKVGALVIVKNGAASMSWDSMNLQLQAAP